MSRNFASRKATILFGLTRMNATQTLSNRCGVSAAFLSTLLILSLNCARADWRFDGETGVFYDSNLSNSDRAPDEKEDLAWESKVRAGNGFQLSRDFRLNLSTDFHSAVWDRYDAFNEIGGGVAAALRYRFGLGRQAPWILLDERIGYDGFR